jgi:hypothetical protein
MQAINCEYLHKVFVFIQFFDLDNCRRRSPESSGQFVNAMLANEIQCIKDGI